MKRVYFLRPVGQLGPIKIGCSKLPELRLDNFTIWSPTRLELICSVPGSHKDERTLHAMFEKHRVHGEWFGASKELLTLIDVCAETGELPELPQVIKFPKTSHVGHRGRAKGKSEPRALNSMKMALATVLRAQHESGMTAKALAAEHGMSNVTVANYIRAAGGSLVRGRPGTTTGVLDKGRADAFREHYLAGETLQQIGEAFGVSRERVRQVLRKTGVASVGYRPRGAHELTDTEIQAAEMYGGGVPPKDIIAQTGLTSWQINIACRRLGVEIKPAGAWLAKPNDAEITATVCRLYGEGLSPGEIVCRVPDLRFPETIYYYLKKGGVPARTRRGGRGRRIAAHA